MSRGGILACTETGNYYFESKLLTGFNCFDIFNQTKFRNQIFMNRNMKKCHCSSFQRELSQLGSKVSHSTVCSLVKMRYNHCNQCTVLI